MGAPTSLGSRELMMLQAEVIVFAASGMMNGNQLYSFVSRQVPSNSPCIPPTATAYRLSTTMDEFCQATQEMLYSRRSHIYTLFIDHTG